jgi:hypothetical protein
MMCVKTDSFFFCSVFSIPKESKKLVKGSCKSNFNNNFVRNKFMAFNPDQYN